MNIINKSLTLLTVVLLVSACGTKEKEETKETATTSMSTTTSITATAVTAEAEVEAKVTIVKFSDYQCPACKYYVPFVETAKEDFGDDIKVVYKHFPLNMHPNAPLAARSAEAAKKQGKFKQMHDLIFQGQEQWSKGNAESIFIGYAKAIDLDVAQFTTDMNSLEMQQIVMADRREGEALGVNSTPTFFINDMKLDNNPRTYADFKAMIQSLLDS